MSEPTTDNLIELPQNSFPSRHSLYRVACDCETDRLIHNAKVVGECYRIRVLFDTEHLKNDNDYISIIEDTWLKTFKDTDPELLEQAVQEFIVSDKKGYLPKPGQIVELLVKGIKAIESRRYWQEIERLERKLLFEKYVIDDQ